MSAHELVLELAATLDEVASDLASLGETEEWEPLWPREVIEAMEELIALRVVLRHVVEVVPDQAAGLRQLFRRQRASAHWEAPRPPALALLPDTLRQIETSMERLRVERLLDRDLDRALSAP